MNMRELDRDKIFTSFITSPVLWVFRIDELNNMFEELGFDVSNWGMEQYSQKFDELRTFIPYRTLLTQRALLVHVFKPMHKTASRSEFVEKMYEHFQELVADGDLSLGYNYDPHVSFQENGMMAIVHVPVFMGNN
jgi:hypothetical protein